MTDGPAPKSVLARGAALLRACGDSEGALSLAELALRTGLPKPTAHRLLGELVRLGLVERAPDGRYRIGLALFVLGQSAPSARELRDIALPYLGDLHEETHENVHLAVPDGPDTLFLEKITGRRATPIVSRTGGRLPGPLHRHRQGLPRPRPPAARASPCPASPRAPSSCRASSPATSPRPAPAATASTWRRRRSASPPSRPRSTNAPEPPPGRRDLRHRRAPAASTWTASARGCARRRGR